MVQLLIISLARAARQCTKKGYLNPVLFFGFQDCLAPTFFLILVPYFSSAISMVASNKNTRICDRRNSSCNHLTSVDILTSPDIGSTSGNGFFTTAPGLSNRSFLFNL